MFLKFFSDLPAYNKTSLNIRLSCQDKITGGNVVVTRKQQSSPEDFKEAEKVFKKRMNDYISPKNIAIKIELDGKLNGIEITQQFTDLDSYYQFLKNNELVNEIEIQTLN
jgi:hypothetical protein